MSLIVALKYKDGSLLATDTRVMYGEDIVRDQLRKLEILTDDILGRRCRFGRGSRRYYQICQRIL